LFTCEIAKCELLARHMKISEDFGVDIFGVVAKGVSNSKRVTDKDSKPPDASPPLTPVSI
jgi:hypothetical protein